MSLSENLKKFMNDLLSFKQKGLKNNPHATLLTYDIKSDIKTIIDKIDSSLIVDASVGKGTWADIPWISIRNQKFAPSMGKGIYPVYLFSSDGSGFYLSLNQGVLSAGQKINKLQQQKYRENIKNILKNTPQLINWGEHSDNIDLKANTPLGKNYEFANISAKYYSIDNLPTNQKIQEDLSELLSLYLNIDENIISSSIDEIESVNHQQNFNLSNQPLNQILYGPPGTGKTYETVERAVEICDPNFEYETQEQLKTRYDELIENKQISFVAFHQSFSYEDFVEGIRAKTKNGQIKYDIEDGIFKEICKLAQVKEIQKSNDVINNIEDKTIWKMSLGDTQDEDQSLIYNECIANNYVLLGYGYNLDYTNDKDYNSIKNRLDDNIKQSTISMINSFVNEMKLGDLVVVTDGNHQFRAIAEITGNYSLLDDQSRDSYLQLRGVKWLRVFSSSLPVEQMSKVNFMQRTIYKIKRQNLKLDQFIEYITPDKIIDNSKKNYVLIIDEINRGNIANIFGELITILEPSKRAGNHDARSVILPYSKKTFSVPNNLYVIGTMNTSDHSLTKLDLALRRRFDFVELLPDYGLLNDIEVHGVNIGEMLKIMNDRIEVLLGRDYLIGHSYFLLLKDSDEKEEVLADIFKNKIIPLLQEYFFEAWERIQWVLNDQNKKNEKFQFVKLMKNNNDKDYLTKLFGSLSELNHISDRRYQINKDAFKEAEAYLKILAE